MKVNNPIDTLKSCMEEKGVSQAAVSMTLGENRQNLNNQMRTNDMKVSRFIQVLGVLGYQLMVVESE